MPQFWRHFCGSGSLFRRKETKENLLKTKQSQIMMLCIGLMNADFLTPPFSRGTFAARAWLSLFDTMIRHRCRRSKRRYWFTPMVHTYCRNPLSWELLAANCRRHYVWSSNPQSDKEKWSNARVRCNRSSATVTTRYDIPLWIWSLRLWS